MSSAFYTKSVSYLLLLLLLVTSCYSPKSKVEEDKHPDVPEFPAFDSPDVKVEKVIELNIGKDASYSFGIRNNQLLVYIDGAQDFKDEYKEEQHFLLLKKGKVLAKSFWKDVPHGGSFFGKDGSLYLGDCYFRSPMYSKRKEIPYYSMNKVRNQYHDEHSGSYDNKATREISELQLQLQTKLFGKIKTICSMSGEQEAEEFYPSNSVYLCNANSGKPFYIDADLFDDVSLTKDGKTKYSNNKTYIEQVRPIVSYINSEQTFGELDENDLDEGFFTETESIVVGNDWHSSGNHYVGSFGYTPIKMFYYDIDYKGKTVKTKENNLNQKIDKPVKIGSAWYFVSMNKSGTKMTIYYLD